MNVLLNSLAKKGASGASLNLVNNWIKSNMFTRSEASMAYEKGYIYVKNMPEPYVFLSNQGFAYLHKFNKQAHFGRPKWNPQAHLRHFMDNYSQNFEN